MSPAFRDFWRASLLFVAIVNIFGCLDNLFATHWGEAMHSFGFAYLAFYCWQLERWIDKVEAFLPPMVKESRP